MLANHDWRLRHAGLMAIAAVGEGTSKVRRMCLYPSDAGAEQANSAGDGE